MTDKQALSALIEAVEGGASAAVIDFYTPLDWADGSGDLGLVARSAFNGSLDAAKALHEALLPGWSFCISMGATVEKIGDPDAIFGGWSENHARAWLIAILKAYEAQQ